jgi:hypothetical protein
MVAKKRQERMRAWCQDVADTGPTDVLVEAWEAHPACCGALPLEHVAQGDINTLQRRRPGMDLSVVSDTLC